MIVLWAAFARPGFDPAGAQYEKIFIAETPPGRGGQPEDIAKVAVFLASDDAAITGGAPGTGLAAAKRFIEEGALVFIFGRRCGATSPFI